MKKRVGVIGLGKQGVAAAYDLALYGDLEAVVCAEPNQERLEAGVARLRALLPNKTFEAATLDIEDEASLTAFLSSVSLVISAVPYRLHPLVQRAAMVAGCSVVDMGLDTPDAVVIHERTEEAAAKGICIVTDCGLAPGLVSILAAGLIQEHPDAHTVRAYCGGLPVTPVPPIGYVLRFSMDSLIGEYEDEVCALRGGEVVSLEPLEELETLHFDFCGDLEAFTTSGGTGTAPYSFRGKVTNYEYKTLRYPGHCQALKLFRHCGFWSHEPSARSGETAREVFCTVMERTLDVPSVRDRIVGRVIAVTATHTYSVDYGSEYDEATQFTAMERMTGFLTAIAAHEVLAGRVPPGAQGCETALDPQRVLAAMKVRDLFVGEAQVAPV